MTDQKIWIPSKDYEWILADIINTQGDSVTAKVTHESILAALGNKSSINEDVLNKPTTVKVKSACLFHPEHLSDLDDLCSMSSGHLHEGPLLHILRRRFLRDQIYTYCGDILISINPYKLIPKLYDNPLEHCEKEDSPHVYVVACRALKKLSSGSENYSKKTNNQCVVISGESGAGKTEASKYLINFLIKSNESANSSQSQRIKDIILYSTNVLEAFGNAVTGQNHNSSRFGKYIKLQYTKDNILVSAVTEAFLLEKSRIVSVGKDERNYHVFYQLLNGITPNNDISVPYDYVTDSEKDSNDFELLCKALSDIGCSETDISSIWSILAAILHLGNATFIPPTIEGTPVSINLSTASLAVISDLLGVDEKELLQSLTTHLINTRHGSSIKIKLLNVAESTNNVRGLIKKVYQSVFHWLLQIINDDSSLTRTNDAHKFIGVLDIFGFEILEFNSFEQLCINYTNERLQQQFNDLVFASEQELYTQEGLKWTNISYHDNHDVIEVISKKPTGLLYILEEHCMMNRSEDDTTLLNVYHQTHGDNPKKIYVKSRFGNDPTFTIKHFAGGVTYNIEGFISKNYDTLQDDITELFSSSSNEFLKRILHASNLINAAAAAAAIMAYNPSIHDEDNHPSASGKYGRYQRPKSAKALASLITVTASVRSQIDALMNAVRTTEPHYIKCIKPNDLKAADIFQCHHAMTQIRYSDIIEVIRIRRERFPIRMKFSEFYTRYECLLNKINNCECAVASNEEEAKNFSKCITDNHLSSGSYQFGRTLVFLKENASTILQNLLKVCLKQLEEERLLIQQENERLEGIARRLREEEEAERQIIERAAQLESERKREEEARLIQETAAAEEARKAYEEQLLRETELARIKEAEEEARRAQEAAAAEELRLQEEAAAAQEESRRIQEAAAIEESRRAREAEEARLREEAAQEEARRQQEAAAAEEALKLRQAEESRREEEAAEARRVQEAEEARIKDEAAAAIAAAEKETRRQQEAAAEEARKIREDEEIRRQVEAEAAAAAAAALAEEVTRRQQEAAEAALRARIAEEEVRQKEAAELARRVEAAAEEEAKRAREVEEARILKEAEEARLQEAAAAAAAEAEARRAQEEEAELARKLQESEEAKRRAEAEEAQRVKEAEEESRRQEEEARRLVAEAAAAAILSAEDKEISSFNNSTEPPSEERMQESPVMNIGIDGSSILNDSIAPTSTVDSNPIPERAYRRPGSIETSQRSVSRPRAIAEGEDADRARLERESARKVQEIERGKRSGKSPANAVKLKNAFTPTPSFIAPSDIGVEEEAKESLPLSVLTTPEKPDTSRATSPISRSSSSERRRSGILPSSFGRNEEEEKKKRLEIERRMQQDALKRAEEHRQIVESKSYNEELMRKHYLADEDNIDEDEFEEAMREVRLQEEARKRAANERRLQRIEKLKKEQEEPIQQNTQSADSWDSILAQVVTEVVNATQNVVAVVTQNVVEVTQQDIARNVPELAVLESLRESPVAAWFTDMAGEALRSKTRNSRTA